MHGYFATLFSNSVQGFTYRRDVSLDNTGSNEIYTAIQIKIILNSTNFDFANAKINGEDVRFYDGVNQLNYFKESYNSSTKNAVFYVKINLNSSLVNTLSIYYGNLSLFSTSNWKDTMQRFELNRYGGDTKYLLKFNEGFGTLVLNEGSVGGSITVVNSWVSNNNYGYVGSSLNFNGISSNIIIPDLLNVFPLSGEISLSFIANNVSDGKTIFSKYNRLAVSAPDFGDYIKLFIDPTSKNLCFISVVNNINTTAINTSFVIELGLNYKITLIWGNEAIGLYVNGKLIGRAIFYKANGFGDFKIGSFSDPFTGVSNLFFDGTINDFRYTDYTNGQIPSLVHVEAEHNLTRFYVKNKRTKFNNKKNMIVTNFPNGNVNNYKAEPFGMFDNGLFKLWYSAGDSYIHYRESTTSLGLKNATDQLVLGGGIGSEAGDPSTHSIYKENGIYYMFYNRSFSDTVYVVTSTDGINWGNKKAAITLPASGWGSLGLVNTWVVKVNGVYQMFVEAKDPLVNWSLGRATSSTPDGLYSIVDAPINAFKINGTGSSGGVSGWFDGLKYNLFYHANPVPSVVYDQTYFTSTSDLITYNTEQNPTIGIEDDITAYDQTADVTIFTDGQKIYFDYSALDNRSPFFAGIIRCEFNGTYDQLKKDLTITIGAEQVL